ncbi:MAG: 4-(cytidine 5'-diphospho)-2-C-methyl-D-erythritol kinase, partial [Acidimicrobiia bacterium]|nr:4-(cytidine 5'-diphospho)-2-C-methyl-D-erythritol kinase [Acidimicrobiia bacterium]
MTLSLAAAAYAKVNLALVVRSRTADGFHPLLGLFQSVSLADTVRLTSANEDGVTVSNDEAPSDTSNVAWTAVERIRGLARMPAPIHLEISKRIPSGAGLGGGSADAAAVVGLLGERFGVERENREEIAASLGSDVPFALVGGTATVRGRGEILEPREPLRGFGLAVVVPPFALSTP